MADNKEYKQTTRQVLTGPDTEFFGQHPEITSVSETYDDLQEFIQFKNQESLKVQDDVAKQQVPIGLPPWTQDTQYIARYTAANFTEVPIAELVSIIRKSRDMADKLADRAKIFAEVFRPTEPIQISTNLKDLTGVDTNIVTPAMFECILKKATGPLTPVQSPQDRLNQENKTSDLLARNILDANDVIQKNRPNFGLSLLILLLRIVLKFIVRKVLGLFCLFSNVIPVIPSLLDGFCMKAFKFQLCGAFDLASEMRSVTNKKLLAGQTPPESQWWDMPESDNQEQGACSDDAIRETSPADQAKAQEVVAEVLAHATKGNMKTGDDILKYKDEWSQNTTSTIPVPNPQKKVPGGWMELTIADRINAQSTSYHGTFDRLEHKLVTDNGLPVDGTAKKAVYDFIMNADCWLKGCDQTLSAFTHMNFDTSAGPFSAQSWLCCAIRLIFTIFIINKTGLTTAEQQSALAYMQKGIGFTMDTNKLLGEDTTKKLKVMFALMDAVLGRLLGSTSISTNLTDLLAAIKSITMNLYSELKNMGLEMLSMLLSTIFDVLDAYLVDTIKDPNIREAIEICEPVSALFNYLMCGLNAMQAHLFQMLADQWKKNNTAAQAFEFMYDINMQYKTVTFFSDLLRLVLNADERIRNICGLSSMMSDLDRANTIESIRKELGVRNIDQDLLDRANDVPEQDRSQYIKNLKTKVDQLKTPVYDPDIPLGPRPGYIENDMFRTNKYGGNAFTVGTSPIYKPQAPVAPIFETAGLQPPVTKTNLGNCAEKFNQSTINQIVSGMIDIDKTNVLGS